LIVKKEKLGPLRGPYLNCLSAIFRTRLIESLHDVFGTLRAMQRDIIPEIVNVCVVIHVRMAEKKAINAARFLQRGACSGRGNRTDICLLD